MTPNLLRQLWSLVESTQTNVLLKLDDSSLVELLLKQLHHQHYLDGQQADILSDYIRRKMPLIRDLAQQR